MASSRFTELASIIAQNTAKIEKYCSENTIPLPSFEPSPDGMSFVVPPGQPDILAARSAVVSATFELHNLTKGPQETLMGLALMAPNDLLGLQAVSRFGLTTTVPLGDEGITYADLSRECGLNEGDLKRLCRQAMTHNIFSEKNGKVFHTAASAFLYKSDQLRSFIELQLEDYLPSACKALDSLKTEEGIQEPGQSGFALANNTDKGLYDVLQVDEKRGKRFANAMSAFASSLTDAVGELSKLFPWSSMDIVVDVGGGRGPVSVGLAKLVPGTRFVVQDLVDAVESGPGLATSEGVGKRVMFEAADFLKEQTVKGADVYFFRAIFANWPSEYCVRILRNQIPALKAGAHILIEDGVTAEPWAAGYPQRFLSSLDLSMLTWFGGGGYRTLEGWRTLLSSVDPCLVIQAETPVPRSPRYLFDLVWRP